MPPDSIHIRRSAEGHAPLLKSLLEQNDLKAFYQHAKTVLTAINNGYVRRKHIRDTLAEEYKVSYHGGEDNG